MPNPNGWRIRLWLASDGLKATARLAVRRIASHRLAEGGHRGGRVALHKVDVATEDVHSGRVGKHLLIELQQRERIVVFAGTAEAERRGVERRLAEVVGVAAVVPLSKIAVGADGRVAARGHCGIDKQRCQRQRSAHAAMTGDTAHLEPGARTTGDRVESPIDLLHHAHHLSRDELGALLVNGEVEALQRHPFFAHVAKLTAHAESEGNVSHRADDFGDGRRTRDDLHVDERVRRPLAGWLRSESSGERESYETDEEESHDASGRGGRGPEVQSVASLRYEHSRVLTVPERARPHIGRGPDD